MVCDKRPWRCSPAASTSQLKVVTSTSLIAQIVARVSGDTVEVVNIIPPAQCPGHFDVTPGDIQKLADADLFLLHNWQGEKFSQDLIASANNPGLTVVKISLEGIAFISLPVILKIDSQTVWAKEIAQNKIVRDVVRKEILFAGIRKPIKERKELEPRIERLKKVCAEKIAGPLTHIFRFDTPVDGFDSEIGFPVSAEINTGDIITHKLRTMHFYTLIHEGSIETLRETTGKLYQYMNRTGLSPELELVEVYHHTDPQSSKTQRIQVMASFLAWPEVYRDQLIRVLRKDTADKIWMGGEKMTPHTLVDERCAWVAETVNRLKKHTTVDQQFDILSRVALVRPIEDVMKYKKMYEETRDINTIFQAQNRQW